MIEGIERLNPELERARAAEPDVLREREVDVHHAVAARDAAAAVPKCEGGRLRERLGIEPARERPLARRQRGIPDDVGAEGAGREGVRGVRLRRDGERWTGLERNLSSDARYLAYSPVDTPGIVLKPFPSGSGQITVTSLDASGVRFSRDDSEIFFWVDDAFMAAILDLSGPRPVVGTPQPLLEASAARLLTGTNFDPAPDGRFLMVQQPGTSPAPAGTPPDRITIVQNGAAEFTRFLTEGRVAR